MRTFVKTVSATVMAALVVACGDAPVDVHGSDPVPNPVPNGPTSAPEQQQGDRDAEINALIAGAGHISSDKKADAEPVKIEDKPSVEIPGANNTTFACTQTEYSLTKVPEKFVALNPNADVLWPGSLVQGKSMAGGILDPIPVKRAPGTITLTLASGGGGPFYKTMDAPSLSSATQAQNEILASYTGATPAKFSYSYTSIYSAEQLRVAVDANVEGTNWSAGASLSVDKSDEKSRFLIQFSQEYFTMAFDPPQGAAGVFAPEVTAKDLEPYAAAGNPPVYVSGVTYGRIFYILFESTASQVELDAAVKGSYSSGAVGGSVNASASWKKVINQSTVKAYGLGGNAELAINAVTGTDQFEKIAMFLTKGANFDTNNPGVPISYTIRHLTDSSQVKLSLTTEYTAKNCTPVAMGCDGVKSSTKTVDVCGVCGGDGSTCKGCAATAIRHDAGNGAFVTFNLGAGDHGTRRAFPNGSYYKYIFPECRRVQWASINFVCNAGTWGYDGTQGFGSDALCHGDSNESWSDGGSNWISTGAN